jgi:hypothetical protein
VWNDDWDGLRCLILDTCWIVLIALLAVVAWLGTAGGL